MLLTFKRAYFGQDNYTNGVLETKITETNKFGNVSTVATVPGRIDLAEAKEWRDILSPNAKIKLI